MYDVIVVGARCAGAATAMLLARKGHRVLMVDRAGFPSDVAMSTHLVWHAGVESLSRWGLAQAVEASNCPPLVDVTLDLGAFALRGSPATTGPARCALAPRRIVLDQILVDAAVAAGVEFRPDFSVTELLREGDRVTGVKGEGVQSQGVEERARIVLGADGSHSRIARRVEAAESHPQPELQATYFSYFSGLEVQGIEFFPRPGRMVYAWPTNDGRVLVGISWRLEDLREVRHDVDKHFHAELAALAPGLGERVRSARRDAPWVRGGAAGFFRQAFGPGWALVGDAGVTMDPITAAGITNAFRDADLLADKLDAGLSGHQPLEQALAQFQQERDQASMPVYGLTCQMAALAEAPAEMMKVFEALQGNQADIDRYFGVFAQTVPVMEFFDPANLQRIVSQA
ncbi:NAD(P)/FAD-dependent oxidoreductase [Variovorax sp. J22R24]|uniref:NAD(P)/FAD-dependent oxidoreductase n=1 Tax=Variovorax gracilis TaxID=3053502 RepID=UPI0025750764|nr:NAD(P)/FAD-dependent oxidoreductase [Variovorax sp. J22R24]MDM0109922.1 NAD(P)/FAD-dependent oxidoreductase [Variovorax sp. J22R24]